MSEPMNHGIKTVVVPARDPAAARDLYAALLGTSPSVDTDGYVGFDVGGQHIGVMPGGGHDQTAPVAYWQVDDIEAVLAAVTAASGTVTEPAREVGGGRTVALFTDVDGNALGLTQDE